MKHRINAWRVVVPVVLAVVIGSVRSAGAQVDATPRYGPDLALGYYYAPSVRATAYGTYYRDHIAGKGKNVFGLELATDVKVASEWILSARMPVLESRDITGDNQVVFGNLALEATHVHPVEFNAESFVGILFPVVSFGIVLPTGRRPGLDVAPQRAFVDGLTLYRPDTAALTGSAALRIDLYLFYGLFVQSGPRLEVLDTGDVVGTWNNALGFDLFNLRPWKLILEHAWVRQAGSSQLIDPLDPACTPKPGSSCNLNGRTFFRVGTQVDVGHVVVGGRVTLHLNGKELGPGYTMEVSGVF